MYSQIKAMEAIKAIYGKPPVNIRFLIEGEEEVGGLSVAEYVKENPAKLKADVALVCDTEMYAPGLPTLNIGLRGLVYMEIEAVGPMRDLHSGLYGGAAPNAVFGLIELLAKAKDANGRIQIPGIYDDVEPPAPEEKKSWEHLPFDEKEYLKNEVGSTELTGEKQYSVFERTWARPTFEVHGIAGGFTGAGAKTVIPAKAVAKVSIRLVPRQDPDKVVRAVELFLKQNAPKGIQCSLRVRSDGQSGSSGDPCRGQSFQRCLRQADGVHAFGRLDSDCGRLRHLPRHPHDPDGLRTAGRRAAFSQ
jgi:acetylornithine deacetylase/succinyl-diaminopimelate desuccinylase-like protein